MPILRPDSIFSEFAFTEEEKINARILNILQIAWLQTRYCELFKEKGSTIVPESTELDRSFLLRIAEIEGKLNMIQEIFESHKSAMSELSIFKQQEQPITPVSVATIDTISTRASQQVHKQQES